MEITPLNGPVHDAAFSGELKYIAGENEAYYQQLIQTLPVAIYSTDVQGYITSYNPAAVALWGRQPEPGKDRWTGFHRLYLANGDFLPTENSPLALTLKEGHTVTLDLLMAEQPDGKKRYIKMHPRLVFDNAGSVAGAINVLIDFTDVLRSEQELKENERKLRMMTEAQAAEIRRWNEELRKAEERHHKLIEEVEDYAILLLNREGIIQNWNKGAEKIKGYKEHEIVGRHFRIFYQPEDQQKGVPESLIELAAKTGKALHEGWRVRKDGTRFWGSIVITALHDADNNIIGFSKVTRDLTERKNAEDETRRHTQLLEAQNNELRHFTYAAAHDIKEPLRKVLFYTTTVLESNALQLPEKERNYLKRAADASKRMQRLIEDLLTYTKSTLDGAVFEPVDLNTILDEVKILHQETIDQTQAVLEIKPLPHIWGIPFQVRQLFDNVVGNALKYHHSSRRPLIQVSYETARAVSADAAGQPTQLFYKISVQDNGIGFEPEHAERIFEMFERLHSRDSYPGTGIGLSLCKKIVQNHKGTIYASGKTDEGARFDIYLPADNGR
jgi:PAS domain S-box-containing protein